MDATLTDRELIQRLWDYGHFSNPDCDDARNVVESDLDSLVLTDRPVKEAIHSYQSWFRDDLDDLTRRHHGRMAMVDGGVGPATRELLDLPRCGVPDFAADGPQEANWPTACRRELTFAPKTSLFRGLSDAEELAVHDEMTRNWAGALDDLRIEVVEFSRSAHIWATAGALPGSTLAWSYLANNNCGSHLEQRYDTTFSWAFLMALTTECHEVGHAIGLPHNNDRQALMYPAINQASRERRGFPNATDLRQCRSIGYTVAADPKPLPEDPDPPSPPPPIPGQPRFSFTHDKFAIVVTMPDGTEYKQPARVILSSFPPG